MNLKCFRQRKSQLHHTFARSVPIGFSSFGLSLVGFLLLTLPQLSQADVPFELPSPEALARVRSGVIQTQKGEIFFVLFPEDAPWHVANFKYLADKGFYKGKEFHIVEKGYIVQGGRAPGTLPDSPGYSLPPEFNSHKHNPGTLGMARFADSLNPERRSHGRQFHILLRDAPHMDGAFTVFGQVVRGMHVVELLEPGDRIENVVVYVQPEKE